MSTLLAVLLAAPATAGGLGVLTTAGAHSEQLYFYANRDAAGNLYPTIDDYEQFRISETLPHFGGGLELVLGDRDDKIVGNCRFVWVVDQKQHEPDVSGVDFQPTDGGQARRVNPGDVVVAEREEARHLGMALVGLSWGIVGDPDGFMLSALGHVGSAFLTFDHTEFLTVDIGPSFTYRATRQVQLFADLQYQLRYRKSFDHAGNAFLGARYLFD